MSSQLSFDEMSRQKRQKLVQRHTIKSLGMKNGEQEWTEVEKDINLHRVFAQMNKKHFPVALDDIADHEKSKELLTPKFDRSPGSEDRKRFKKMMNNALVEFVEKIKEIKNKSIFFFC